MALRDLILLSRPDLHPSQFPEFDDPQQVAAQTRTPRGRAADVLFPEEESRMPAIRAGALDVVTAGTLPAIEGLIRSIPGEGDKTFAERYRENKRNSAIGKMIQGHKLRDPVASMVGSLMGAGAGLAVPPLGVMRTGQALKTGLTYGALSGVGKAEGLEEIPTSAATDAALGYAGAKIVGPIAKLAQSLPNLPRIRAHKFLLDDLGLEETKQGGAIGRGISGETLTAAANRLGRGSKYGMIAADVNPTLRKALVTRVNESPRLAYNARKLVNEREDRILSWIRNLRPEYSNYLKKNYPDIDQSRHLKAYDEASKKARSFLDRIGSGRSTQADKLEVPTGLELSHKKGLVDSVYDYARRRSSDSAVKALEGAEGRSFILSNLGEPEYKELLRGMKTLQKMDQTRVALNRASTPAGYRTYSAPETEISADRPGYAAALYSLRNNPAIRSFKSKVADEYGNVLLSSTPEQLLRRMKVLEREKVVRRVSSALPGAVAGSSVMPSQSYGEESLRPWNVNKYLTGAAIVVPGTVAGRKAAVAVGRKAGQAVGSAAARAKAAISSGADQAKATLTLKQWREQRRKRLEGNR